MNQAEKERAAKIGRIEGVIIFFKLRENFLNLIHAVEDSTFGGAIKREHDAHPHRRVYQNQQCDKARRIAESYFRRNFKAAELARIMGAEGESLAALSHAEELIKRARTSLN